MKSLLSVIFLVGLVNGLYGQIGAVIWEENFDTFDATKWNIDTGDGCQFGPNICGWGNFELQNYLENNILIEKIPAEPSNNALVLEIKRETVNNKQFTSGRINSADKVTVKYGLVEVRMQVPDMQTGFWPAVWLKGVSESVVGWPRCGELDMMEMGFKAAERTRQGHPASTINNYVAANLIWYADAACNDGNPTCAAAMAYDPGFNKPYQASAAMNDRFVIYRMYWSDQSIRFTVIDNETEYDLYESAISISSGDLSSTFRQPFYLILNMAVGGSLTDASQPGQVTAPMPAKMYVDYIKVMEWNGQGEVALTTAVHDPSINTPGRFILEQNYPNPFNPSTRIDYHLNVGEQVQLSVYNVLGQNIAALISEWQEPGWHNITWDASRLPAGIYYYRLKAGAYTNVKKMVLLK